MKIALITSFPPTSGMGKYAYSLYVYLNKQRDVQADLISLNPFEGYKDVGEGKVIIVNKGLSRLNSLKNYFLNPHRIPKGYDVYHITNEWLGIYAKYNRPSIVTFHDVFLQGPGSEYARMLPSAPKLLSKRLEWSKIYHWFGDRSKKASKFAERIICNSEFTKRNIVSVLNVKAEKVDVAYGLMGDCYKPRDKLDSRKRLGLPLKERMVLSVGGDETPVKNIPNVIKAYHIVQRRLKDVLLIHVGSLSRETLSLIEKLGIKDKLVQMRNLSEEDLALVYNASDVLCFPVLYAGFGMPVVEAFASGCPVIASNYAALPEVIGDAGCFADPLDPNDIAEAIENVLSDNKLREELIEKSLRRAKEIFSPDIWVKKTIFIYKEVLRK
jgi:glycosyltransferase involved in cell wall biosynthesis